MKRDQKMLSSIGFIAFMLPSRLAVMSFNIKHSKLELYLAQADSKLAERCPAAQQLYPPSFWRA